MLNFVKVTLTAMVFHLKKTKTTKSLEREIPNYEIIPTTAMTWALFVLQFICI